MRINITALFAALVFAAVPLSGQSGPRPIPRNRDTTQRADPRREIGPWTASTKGHTYYRTGCSTANKLAVKNRIYFKSEEEANKAGYSRSRSRGC
jgi:hypothetical protein